MVDAVVQELAQKRVGRTLKGKWRLDRLLGVGGMAAVYAATHRNGARVAIKMLHPTVSASAQVRARFVREGYLANRVDHPGVVRVLDDDVDDFDGSAFLVMDLVLGSTLSDRGMERLLDAGELLDVAEQVLGVLVAAHDKGIVHRDMKPDNLLVDARGKIHVLDFGIARLLDESGSASATKTGTTFGTPGFMAPEQAMGRVHQVSGRTDVYSLGATLFALASGDFVHAAENPQELSVLVATQPARSIGALVPQLHPAVVALIDRATQHDAADRWASAQEMLDEVRRVRVALDLRDTKVLPIEPLEADFDFAQPVIPEPAPVPDFAMPPPSAGFIHSPMPMASSAHPPEAVVEPKPRRRGAWAVALGVGAVAIVIVAFALTRSSPPPSNASSPTSTKATVPSETVAPSASPTVPVATVSAPPSASVSAPPSTSAVPKAPTKPVAPKASAPTDPLGY